MRKIIGSILVCLAMAAVSLFALPPDSSPGEFDARLLKGMNYVRIQCCFNGVPYYRGSQGIKAREAQEFNAGAAEAVLKEAGVPISKKDFRDIYARMEALLTKEGFRILEIRQPETEKEKKSGGAPTIIPTVSLHIDALPVADDGKMVVASVYVTVSIWVSTWSGTEDIQSPVIAWWKNKIAAAKKKDLRKTIDDAAAELTAAFIAQCKEAGKEENKQNSEKEGERGR